MLALTHFKAAIQNHEPHSGFALCRNWLGVLVTTTFAFFAIAVAATPAHADLVLSEVIVDFDSGQPPRHDIEVFNDGTERLYVLVEPAEIKAPGTAAEARDAVADPEALGLLVTPNRLVLEPGQRKLVRIASMVPPGPQDRIYRVTFKPVVGAIETSTSGLKILVGYDVLVILRPMAPQAVISARRTEQGVILTNTGNSNAELFDGQQCDSEERDCVALASKRLYAGASWLVPHSRPTSVRYTVKVAGRLTLERF